MNKVFMAAIIPNRNEYYVGVSWHIIKEFAQKIIDQVMEEYSLQNLWQEIYFGNVHLYMAYELPWDKPEPPTNKEMQDAIIKHLSSDKLTEGFIGYAVLRTNMGNDAFLWHVYLVNPAYSKQGFDWLEAQASMIGAKYFSCAVYNPAMERLISDLGFKKTYSNFRKEIKKEK